MLDVAPAVVPLMVTVQEPPLAAMLPLQVVVRVAPFALVRIGLPVAIAKDSTPSEFVKVTVS